MLTPLRILIVEDSLTDTELMLYELRPRGSKRIGSVDTEPDYLARLGLRCDYLRFQHAAV